MKNSILLILSLLFAASLHAQISQNVDMLGNWDDDDIPSHFFGTFNDVWGYANDNGEFAIMGSAAYIHILDVTDPNNIVQIDTIAGGAQIVWRDFKTYQDRAYCVADNSGEGLIILDLSQLPNSVSVVSQTDIGFSSAHNIYIDEAQGRMYVVASDAMANIVVYDLATDPDNPTEMGRADLPGGNIHDLYVRDNIVYAASEFDGFFIYDMTDPSKPTSIASLVTNGYNHSCWVSEDGSYAIFAEEVPVGLPLGVMDLSDMMSNDLNATYFQETLLPVDMTDPDVTLNTPHNPYLIGDFMITSYYEDGVHIYDMSDPFNPTLAGYYDTFPENTDYNGYAGCWGVYPYLPSGNIIASDMDNGLFVLKYDELSAANELPSAVSSFNVYPNPTQADITLEIESTEATDFTYQVLSITGQLLQEGQFSAYGKHVETVQTSLLSNGMYLLTLQNAKQKYTEKISVIK